MDTIVILIITALVALYIALPFFLRKKYYVNDTLASSQSVNQSSVADRLISLNNQKETLYSAIRDIDFDYGLGKLSKDDYEELNNKYRDEAASVLKQIDDLEKEGGVQTFDQELEQEILSYRKVSTSSIGDDAILEEEISVFRAANINKQTCSECGAEYTLEDAFCSKCGVKLNK